MITICFYLETSINDNLEKEINDKKLLNFKTFEIQKNIIRLKEDFVKDLPEEQTNDNVFIKYANDKIKKRKVSKELGKKLWEILK